MRGAGEPVRDLRCICDLVFASPLLAFVFVLAAMFTALPRALEEHLLTLRGVDGICTARDACSDRGPKGTEYKEACGGGWRSRRGGCGWCVDGGGGSLCGYQSGNTVGPGPARDGTAS